ncbi:hypothetical protein [Caldalkalibacillus mannanilyticus]|uniref:hypothetical protein n=1 Tax=Caldalkalibacillus mannanilyticus TaxID=1418 RepID=UPI00046A1FFC|nr:hypothetical protein [Caldalkalibacillus mannanilyticus]
MRCVEVQSLTAQYYADQVDEYTRIRIHHHLSQCPHCTEAYEMWKRGEEYLSSLAQVPSPTGQQSLNLKQSVMGRIQQEEKWANPVVNRPTNNVKKPKVIFSFFLSMLLILVILASATLFIPEQTISTDSVTQVKLLDGFDINKIVIKDSVGAETDSTSMKFTVVSSLQDPIIYSLPVETNEPPYVLILAVFSIVCIILGMSWITRV